MSNRNLRLEKNLVYLEIFGLILIVISFTPLSLTLILFIVGIILFSTGFLTNVSYKDKRNLSTTKVDYFNDYLTVILILIILGITLPFAITFLVNLAF